MRFTKMHGMGNDYVYVDCFHQPMPRRPGRAEPCASAIGISASAATG